MAKQQDKSEYEQSDAPPWLPAALGSGLAICVAGLLLLISSFFPAALTPTPRGPLQPLPPAPRLQVEPGADLIRYQQIAEQRQDHAPLSIEQAMRTVAKRGWRQQK